MPQGFAAGGAELSEQLMLRPEGHVKEAGYDIALTLPGHWTP